MLISKKTTGSIYLFINFFASKEAYPIVRQLEKITVKKAQVLTLKWPRGGFLGTQDLFFVHFTTFASAFFTVIFSNCLSFGYASFDAKKI